LPWIGHSDAPIAARISQLRERRPGAPPFDSNRRCGVAEATRGGRTWRRRRRERHRRRPRGQERGQGCGPHLSIALGREPAPRPSVRPTTAQTRPTLISAFEPPSRSDPRSSGRRISPSFLLVLTVLLAPAVAMAQVPDADRATARASPRERMLKRGDYAIAAKDFERADALVHAPTSCSVWRAQTGLGKLVKRRRPASESAKAWRRMPRPHSPGRSTMPSAKCRLCPRLAW
jgi:hypothetical protein